MDSEISIREAEYAAGKKAGFQKGLFLGTAIMFVILMFLISRSSEKDKKIIEQGKKP